MKKSHFTALILATLLAGTSISADGQPAPATNPLPWLTDLPQAQSRAKSEGKFVLLFFHGSDWCPTCTEMQHQVFDSPEFAQYARRSLVLVDVDFPEKE